MGCDAHLVLEYRHERNKEYWRSYAVDVEADRNYALFAAMAGVRQRDPKIEPVSEPKGLPEPMSWNAKDFFGEEKGLGSDGHSHTWLTPTEYREAYTRAGLPHTEWDKSYTVLLGLMALLVQEYGEDNVRLLVAFDN